MAKEAGVCTEEMKDFLKWRNLPSLNNYIQLQFLCEKAYTLLAEAQSSGFENKEALKQAANIFFEVLRTEPFIQAYVGLGYLFLLLDQKSNAILYLAEAHKINPYDEDNMKLIEHTLKEDPNLKVHVQDPSFKDDEQELYNFIDDHQVVDTHNHLDDLPAELLVLIFDWLKPTSVAKFRQVNKHYRDLLVNDVYWQEKYSQRWIIPDIPELKKIHPPIPDNQFFYKFYQLNHNMNVNWLNRATKFEEIKKLKGRSDMMCTAPGQGVITVHSSQQQENGQYKRNIEFFRFKRDRLHRVKSLHLELDVAPANNQSRTTFTADHLITHVKDGTLIFTETEKRESKIHKAASPIDVVCGVPRTNGIQFLAGYQKSLTYHTGLETKKSIDVCENGAKIKLITAQYDGKTAAILTSGIDNVKILDVETASVGQTFSASAERLEWMMALSHVLIGLDRAVTFYDVRTKNKFAVPKTRPFEDHVIGVAMDDVKMLALRENALTLFDCRYSSSIVENVKLPQGHAAVPGLALWCSQKVFYASPQVVLEWDLGQVLKQTK